MLVLQIYAEYIGADLGDIHGIDTELATCGIISYEARVGDWSLTLTEVKYVHFDLIIVLVFD
jgi:hypothetical protein